MIFIYYARVTQLIECLPSKQGVAGLNPASRSNFSFIFICLPVGQSDLGRLTWAEEYRWFESNQVDHFINSR